MDHGVETLAQFMKGANLIDTLDIYLLDYLQDPSTCDTVYAPLSNGFVAETLLGDQESSHSLDLMGLQGKPAADIANMLEICGQLFMGQREKELVLGIDCVSQI